MAYSDKNLAHQEALAMLFAGGVIALVCCIWIACFAFAAWGRDLNGQWAQSGLRPWFDSLSSKKGYCCSVADGQDTEYEIRGDHYWAPIDGVMTEVPDDAVITEPNNVGHAMKWIYTQNNQKFFRCFIPASGI